MRQTAYGMRQTEEGERRTGLQDHETTGRRDSRSEAETGHKVTN